MRVVWDERKRDANLLKHGLDFADFENGFSFDRFSAKVVKSGHDGKDRYLFLGKLGGTVVVAIVAPLGTEALSLISLRHASKKERDSYDGS